MNTDYKDIARRNPAAVKAVIESFNYELIDGSDLNRSISELIAREGEPALRAIMNVHPDKEIILELFAAQPAEPKRTCGCGGNCQHSERHYSNFSGNEMAASQKDNSTQLMAQQTNAIMVIATLFIVTALIIKTNK